MLSFCFNFTLRPYKKTEQGAITSIACLPQTTKAVVSFKVGRCKLKPNENLDQVLKAPDSALEA